LLTLPAAVFSWAIAGLLLASLAVAQIKVTTAQNDIARTAQNLFETTLTPANVNSTQFGLLFTRRVSGPVYAQPLYLSGLTLSGSPHNVVFVATLPGFVYAFDADSNSGVNASALWSISLLDTAHGAAPGAKNYGTLGTSSTPVIDPVSNLLYIVSTSFENGSPIFRLHALDALTGAETLGGPVVIAPSVSGSAPDAVNGIVKLSPRDHKQRAGLLLLNGIVYVGFSSYLEDETSQWHGWIVAYNAATLAQTGVFCVSPNGHGGGVWMSGNGLAADQLDPVNRPYGRLFVATGNGDYSATAPYSNNMDYGDSVVALDLTNGIPTVTDAFAPYDAVLIANMDRDQGSGGVLVLPAQASSVFPNLLVQAGKSGTLYLLNRDALGGFNSSGDQVVQELPLALGGQGPQATGGVWSSPSYWNGNIYYWPVYDHLKQFSLANGSVNSTPTQSVEFSAYPGATSSISANGNTQGIVWTIQTDNSTAANPAILEAHDASNVAVTLYSSATVPDRDTAGTGVPFAVPTIANGTVYVGTGSELDVFGLLNDTQTSRPSISPGSSSFGGSLTVTITDTAPNATIYYTTDGTPATTSSTPYRAPIMVTANKTINAIAVAPGMSPSYQTSATYTRQVVAVPTFFPAALAYSVAQSVTISDATNGAVIHYTTDGTKPTTASTVYSGPISVTASETISAIASASGYTTSGVASASYTITSSSMLPVNNAAGFTSMAGLAFLGSANLINNSLQLSVSGVGGQDNAVWSTTPVDVQSFTTDFYFQLTSPDSYGFTFTLQNSPAGLNALGSGRAGLGYQGIASSVAIKFDLYDTAGQGIDSTGFYVNGAAPTVPSIDLTTSGINLHSPDILHAHITYNGTTLTLQLTDTVTAASFTASKAIDIPATVGSTFAYAGFTASTGTATQTILNWTYMAAAGGAVATPTFMPPQGTYPTAPLSVGITDATPGATIYYTTDGSTPTMSSSVYSGAIAVGANETLRAFATADGLPDSPVGTALYLIQTSIPTFVPSAGTYIVGQLVTITASPGATIYYTTNGATPTTSSTVYSGPIALNAKETLKAIAIANGFAASTVALALYAVKALPPTITPPGGTYSSPQTIVIGDSVSNATIYYTTDGTAPSTSSTVYTAPLTVSVNETLKAIAVASGFVTSAPASASYKINAPVPTFAPPAGTYTGPLSVVISDTASNATIYYTTDGTTPTTSSMLYAVPISVSASETLRAIAVAGGYQKSAVAKAAYTIN
jgi:hypothetical protein